MRIVDVACCTTQIKALGGLKAIVISHPHFYTTHLVWAEIFNCPVYTAVEDEEWFSRDDSEPGCRRLLKSGREEILQGVTVVTVGGHFPGSLVLLWEEHLFHADTLMTVPVRLSSKNFMITGLMKF